MEKAIAVVMMTEDEARIWERQVGEAMPRLRDILNEGYEREAWRALGYAGWHQCLAGIAERYGITERHLFRLHAANKTQNHLKKQAKKKELSPGDSHDTVSDVSEPIPGNVLNEVAKIHPDDQLEVWQAMQETAPAGKVTATHAAHIVHEYHAHHDSSAPTPQPEPLTSVDALPFDDACCTSCGVLIEQPQCESCLEQVVKDNPVALTRYAIRLLQQAARDASKRDKPTIQALLADGLQGLGTGPDWGA